MGEIKRAVSNLVQMLKAGQKEATDLVDTIHQLQSYLDVESKNIIQRGLDRLLTAVRIEAAKITRGSVVVLISPEGRATVDKTYSDESSDHWLIRLKSEGFYVLTLDVFSSLIQTLKSKVAEGNLIPIIQFLRANVKIEMPLMYPNISPASTVEQLREPSTSSRWKPPDFLPDSFPHPPLPRGLFKD